MSSQTETTYARPGHSFGGLYNLLAKHFPGHRSQQRALGISQFAQAIGKAHETLYKAVREEKPLSVDVALRIIKLSRTDETAHPLYWEDLVPYTLPDYGNFSREAEQNVSDLLG